MVREPPIMLLIAAETVSKKAKWDTGQWTAQVSL